MTKPMPQEVSCPVCSKVGWTDERSQFQGAYPCFSCRDEFLLLNV